MEDVRPEYLYIVGAGRSGSTILAALLASQPGIRWVGELVHLANWRDPDNLCSCGEPIANCGHWKSLGMVETIGAAMANSRAFEGHRQAVSTLLRPTRIPSSYCADQSAVLVKLASGSKYLLDSSKYVGRALALAACRSIRARYIYIVRDPRGVVQSFTKNVQSRRSTYSACAYYLIINTLAQIAVRTRLRDRQLTVRYEDLVSDHETEIRRIGRFLQIDVERGLRDLRDGMGLRADHVAGGNRWVREGAAGIQPDFEWRQKMRAINRLVIHILCFPLQLLNGYRLW